MVETFSNWVVGTGPRLQMTGPNAEANKRIEAAFSQWLRSARIGSKLRLMCRAGYVIDGEALALAVTNRRLPTEVKLDLRPIEGDYLETPPAMSFADDVVDGVRIDEAGNPLSYFLYPRHPGDLLTISTFVPTEYDAAGVCHWFRRERPGQCRGVSQLASILKTVADLRRYSQAVLGAAETAANIAAAIESQAPAGTTDEADAGAAFEEVELPRRGAVVLPFGTKLSQIKAEQPTQSYEGFRGATLDESGRAVFLPSNLSRGNSSSYNFASGRLDHLDFWRVVRICQQDLETDVLDWLLGLWLDEAALAMPGLLDGLGSVAAYPHRWLWTGYESINPVDDAQAFASLFQVGAATLSDWWGERGFDPAEKIAEWTREREAVAAAPVVAVAGGPGVTQPAKESKPTEPQAAGASS